ncbi:MAG: DUF1080 domain-containing protein [Bacteroidales bacterium]|jgi:hypothetical protein|nr:DUF1080 domain-containing protein [Bacteroidales bacterium]
MKHIIAFIFAFCVCASITAPAQDNKLTRAEKKAGWQLLFNGKDYTGWINNNGKPIAAAVEENSMQTYRCGGYILTYNKPFGNFILKCDVKMSEPCNSGIFLRMSDLNDPVNTGFEIQIATENGSVHGHGALYDVRQASENAGKGAGQWDHFEIKFVGPKLNVQLNGKQILDVNLDEYSEPGKRDIGGNHKFSLNGKPRALKDFARIGYIGFQDHDHKCWYKNVKLLPLP